MKCPSGDYGTLGTCLPRPSSRGLIELLDVHREKVLLNGKEALSCRVVTRESGKRVRAWSVPLALAPRPGAEDVVRSASAFLSADSAIELLAEALGFEPFPWQRRLLSEFLEGKVPRALDLPTGLGKTSVMAIWLLARAAGANLPRRLVYVVDRRAVVDQATEVALRLHQLVQAKRELATALGLENGKLPISTLRGKLDEGQAWLEHVDGRKWLEDPSASAIIVGTVDMIGSRLLFSGYGVSWKMRPYHAGLLGVDSLFVLDEAHLVPPFERLIEAAAMASERGLGPAEEARPLIPPMRLLSLSATGRSNEKAFRLGADDLGNSAVKKRMEAKKRLQIRPATEAKNLAARLAEEATGLVEHGARRILVYCDSRKDAEQVHAELVRLGKGRWQADDVELFVGARRVHERELAAGWLRNHGFMGGPAPERPAFLVATSAAEVGVDLDADAAVMDLVEWERMVQRLGRVNRRGEHEAIVVVVPALAEAKKKRKRSEEGDGNEEEPDPRSLRREACLRLLQALPLIDGDHDASPVALTALRESHGALVAEASTPAPLYPPLSRPLLEAWSMTSLAEHPGRPEVEPWLRGWQEDKVPETTIVFRKYLPVVRVGDAEPTVFDSATLDAFLDAAGPHMAEELVVEVGDALRWLRQRVERLAKKQRKVNESSDGSVFLSDDQVVAVLVRGARDAIPVTKTLLDDQRGRAELERMLSGATLFVDVRLGGLASGLLNESVDAPEDPDSLDLSHSGILPFRIRPATGQADDEGIAEGGASSADGAEEGWREEAIFSLVVGAEGEPIEEIVVERRKDASANSEIGRSVTKREQELDEHEKWVEAEARFLAQRLSLPPELAEPLFVAARLHDEGKRARRWQDAFAEDPAENRRENRVIGKGKRAPRLSVLGKYRHEVGSLSRAETSERFIHLEPQARDLALHLVAAHHGRARPVLPTDDAEEPPTRLRQRAIEAALRFDRLTRRFGPWGLAWLEALLRAADQRASRKLDEA